MSYVDLITKGVVAPHLRALMEMRFTTELERLLGGTAGVLRHMREACAVEDADEEGLVRPIFPHNPNPGAVLDRAKALASEHAFADELGLDGAWFSLGWPPESAAQADPPADLPFASNQELF